MSLTKNIKKLVWATILPATFLVVPAWGQTADEVEKGEEPSVPLRITIYPSYDHFDGVFSEGAGVDAPRIEGDPCPRNQVLSCDLSHYFNPGVDRIQKIVADYVYEQRLPWYEKPALGLLMGKRYVGLKDYLILAQLGIDPGLDPLDPFPQATGGMYGSMWFGDTLDLGDRMAGPIMLAKYKSQVERLGGQRKLFSGD